MLLTLVYLICRKKINARSFSVETSSARDTNGHGTHIASILVGNQVNHTNYYYLEHGNARRVQSATLAINKVCDPCCPDTNFYVHLTMPLLVGMILYQFP